MTVNKNNMIITIDTELGSNGEAVARELGEQLHIPCYAGEILDKASEISGIPARLMHRYDGRVVRAAYDLLAEDEASLKMRPASEFIAAQVAACRALAAQGPCILVDRHASLAMEGAPDHVSIYVHGSFADRCARLAEQENVSAEQVEKKLRRQDRAYRSCYRGAHKGWGEADHYDISISSSDAGVHAMTDTVLRFLETMTGEKLSESQSVRAV